MTENDQAISSPGNYQTPSEKDIRDVRKGLGVLVFTREGGLTCEHRLELGIKDICLPCEVSGCLRLKGRDLGFFSAVPFVVGMQVGTIIKKTF